jgi:hypothetical protein
MSSLIITRLITPCGGIGNSTTANIVDAAGNIKGSPQFLTAFVVDYAGNLGVLSAFDCALLATIIGSALAAGPWEMQQGTVETVGADQGTISNNYINAGNLSNYTSLNCTGIMAGNIGGSGTFTIQNGAQSIGGVAYAGNGLTIFTGNNTCTGTLDMQIGTKIQLGADASNTTTRWAGNLTIQTDAVATQFTGYTVTTYLCQALTNTGTYNIIGLGVCGAGGLGLATTVVNNGIINIEKAMWRNQSTWSGTGTVNVKDGGTFQTTTNTIGSTTRININGVGWCNASGVKVGAINMTGAAATIGARIHVQTAATIKNNTNCNTDFSGLLTGSAPLTVGTLGTPVNGITHFSNTANTYFGTITVDGTTVNASYNNSLQYASIVLANGGRLGTSANTSQVIKSLASTDPTTYWQSGDPVNNVIKANGKTTYAGRLLWTGGQYAANYFLNGGAENELTMTGTGNTGHIYPRNGARLILQGATFTAPGGNVNVQTGATVSAGTSTTASSVRLSIDATSKLEVRAAGAGCGLMNVTTSFVPVNGWKVDLPDAMAAGTYDIVSYLGAATTVLPTIGINNSGRTVTFSYNNALNPKKLRMTLV